MMLIFNLTSDVIREPPDLYGFYAGAKKLKLSDERHELDDGLKFSEDVNADSDVEFIRTEQILTEYGICYVSNNYHALNLSTK